MSCCKVTSCCGSKPEERHEGKKNCCPVKGFLVWLVVSAVGFALSFGIQKAQMTLFPHHLTFYETSGMFQPMENPVYYYGFVHPFFIAMLVMIGRHVVTPCPGKLTFAFALATFPGFMMTTWLKVSMDLAAAWYLGSIIGFFGQAAAAAAICRVVCGKPCCASKCHKDISHTD
ncbi:hypothetical protein Pelo_12415 [Pelomyxa schiedti]|nr:hypothetical protein Pelo_12415 [Pelomyxa schiedti]